jgi:hypothetical protein
MEISSQPKRELYEMITKIITNMITKQGVRIGYWPIKAMMARDATRSMTG